jgi:hypothetical protein
MPGDFKPEFINALRMRQIEQRSLIAHWTHDHCISSSSGVRPLRDGPRPDDPCVLLFAGSDRGEVHASCHPLWLAGGRPRRAERSDMPMTPIRKAGSERGSLAVASL